MLVLVLMVALGQSGCAFLGGAAFTVTRLSKKTKISKTKRGNL